MVWVMHTPTPEEGAEITGLTVEEWQDGFEDAYKRCNVLRLDALGIDTKQIPQYNTNWGSVLYALHDLITGE